MPSNWEKVDKLSFVHPFRRSRRDRRPGYDRHGDPAPAPAADSRRFCCVGGGGLIAGVGAYIKRLRPETKIIGVEAADADAMARSLAAGKRIKLEQVGLFADGAAVKNVGEETFASASNTSTRCAGRHRRDLRGDQGCLRDTRSILEPAGALAIAGARNTPSGTGCATRPWSPSPPAPT